MAAKVSRNDLWSGGIFVAIGTYFAVESLNYELGTLFRMGAGFMPLVLGTVLVGLGLAIILFGLRPSEEDARADPPSWRAIAVISLAIIFFAVCIRGLGFVPTVFVTALLTCFGSRVTGIVGAVAIATGLTVLSTVVFVIGLRLQIPMLGPWLSVVG